MFENIKCKLQYFLPKLMLTRLVGWISTKKMGQFTHIIIKIFVRYYNIDMKLALNSDLSSYLTINDFFIRSLRKDARPIIKNINYLSFPADGIISQIGLINNKKIFQSKGHNYSLEGLLAGNTRLVNIFCHGLFVTTYLSPRDYHRIHMPCDGVLREMIYVPGTLFSVNPLTASNIPNLFSKNERVICVFETIIGYMIQILVGAMIVSSIETIWAGLISGPNKHNGIQHWVYPEKNIENSIKLKKGEEMGRFNLGSTVINLFVLNSVQFLSYLHQGSCTKIGKALAKISSHLITSDKLCHRR
ncbi:Phosphatidylserine decarboxylase proenzyme [Candidatus Ecksteinia adelgidicola]|nr:Phosphatidylserine decarboxylase proenzyme [Candidatus Ecksteinia adelgidicola]